MRAVLRLYKDVDCYIWENMHTVFGGKEQSSIRTFGKLLHKLLPNSIPENLPGFRRGDLRLNHPEQDAQMNCLPDKYISVEISWGQCFQICFRMVPICDSFCDRLAYRVTFEFDGCFLCGQNGRYRSDFCRDRLFPIVMTISGITTILPLAFCQVMAQMFIAEGETKIV